MNTVLQMADSGRRLAGLRGIALSGWLWLAMDGSPAVAQGVAGVTRPAVVTPAPGYFLPPSPPPAQPQHTLIIQVRDPVREAQQKAEAERKGLEFQKQKAAEGFAYAQYELGLRYLDGKGVVKDETLAREWLSRAATNGNRQAVRKLKELSQPIPSTAGR